METSEWWESLPAGIREQVDGFVLQDARMQAVRAVLDVGRARGMGLHDIERVVHQRYLHHGDRVARTPDSPLDQESLAARAAGCPGRVVAIEAVWDGDTVHDWFVILLAILDEPAGERSLATLYWDTAVRYLGDEQNELRKHGGKGKPIPRHPSAVVAERAGGVLAAGLSVPFHFASPDKPDDDAPRWRR
ncbi:hypothetical protein ACFVZH_13145 [Streptomyces sp. NPDC059534]|uniref:hypothetical protein n=1 Tax=Streptomyces sp. NPDC059534 TaxID=3346859 RepID=UPI0036BDB847